MMDQFQQLEEKLGKIVESFKRIRAENKELTGQLEKLRSDSNHGAEARQALEREVETLRRERESVRTRVERLLSQVEALTKQDSAG
ncbi:MAG: cell division protein ZapB [Acidobacteriota bacterium]|nr:cell division protein ZapB [Acidobacteriota bacterium]